jgi:hypothetical protein
MRLKPRDFRTDDGARQPPEMRLPCRLKAVGLSGDPDSLYLVTDAFCSDEHNKTKRDAGGCGQDLLYCHRSDTIPEAGTIRRISVS